MNVLVGKEGPLAGRRVELPAELVVGRENAGLTIDDDELSRRHAVLRSVGSGIEIEDLGSRNGTFVNGVRIEAVTLLAGGDSVKIGKSVLELEAPRAAATVASPVPAAAPAAPSPAAVAVPTPDLAPSDPFGTHAAPAGSRRGVASRQLLPMLFSWGAVGATAIALIVYFAAHR
jgi:hypothetical protein